MDLLTDKRELLDRISKILIARETLERREFEALLAGTPEADVFRERDEKRGQPGGSEPAPPRAPRSPHVGAPAPLSPMTPESS